MTHGLSDDTKIGDLGSTGGSSDDSDSDPDADGGGLMGVTDNDMMLVDASVSCDNCVHQGVCAVYGNFADQVEEQIPSRTGGDPAFEADQLAVICAYFADAEAGGQN